MGQFYNIAIQTSAIMLGDENGPFVERIDGSGIQGRKHVRPRRHAGHVDKGRSHYYPECS
jgi:hypothetical protein